MSTKKIYLAFAGLLLLSQMNSTQVFALGGDHTYIPHESVRSTDVYNNGPSDVPAVNSEDRAVEQQQQLEDQRPITSNTFISVMAVIIVGLLFYVWRTSQKRRMHQ